MAIQSQQIQVFPQWESLTVETLHAWFLAGITLTPTDKAEHMRIQIDMLQNKVEGLEKAHGRHDEDVKRLMDERQELQDVVGGLQDIAASMSYISSHIDTSRLRK